MDSVLSHLKLTGVDELLGFEKSRAFIEVHENDTLTQSSDTVDSTRTNTTSTIGGEGITSGNMGIVKFVIKPYRDLIIEAATEFDMIVPLNWLKTATKENTKPTNGSPRPQPNSINKETITVVVNSTLSQMITANQLKHRNMNPVVNEHGHMLLPYLERSKYALSVWFFAVRNMLKIPLPDQWSRSSAPLLHSSFCLENNETLKLPHPSTSNEFPIHFGVGRTRGKRPYMEDVDCGFDSVEIADNNTISLYCVFDGHGGKDCAEYAAEHVPAKLFSYLRHNKQCTEAMFRAFVDVDREFLESSYAYSNSGSTANAILYHRAINTFVIANIGDARAVLCRRTVALDLSVDRKATNAEEIARIAKEGGFVSNGRVQGVLAVARAMGDTSLKESSHKPILVADPELSCFSPIKGDEFVVIASDGLWDVMPSQAVVDAVREKLVEEDILPFDPEKAIEASKISEVLSRIGNQIAVYAVNDMNSGDNVTVMVVLIAHVAQYVPLIPLRKETSFGGVNDALLTTRRGESRGSSKSSPEQRSFNTTGSGAVIAAAGDMGKSFDLANVYAADSSTVASTSISPSDTATLNSGGSSESKSNGTADNASISTVASSSSPIGGSASARISSFMMNNPATPEPHVNTGSTMIYGRPASSVSRDSIASIDSTGADASKQSASSELENDDDLMDFLTDDNNF